MVDRPPKLLEEAVEPIEVEGVERGDAGLELETGTVEALGITRGDDDIRMLGASTLSSRETDARAAADDHDCLAVEQPRRIAH